MLYLVYAESAQYCGYGQHFVVQADSDREVDDLVANAADDYFYDLYNEELEEDGEDYGPYHTVHTVEEFGPEHESWKYYKDPSQAEFYIEVNF